ncbi:MAG TPA: winged helix-turn-helix domain-containing protein [Rhizomicrobium sp.]|jgi:DNA-binding winged helix-turn-helix (wHTH) protein/Flp pilus assembly protein TadD
MDVRAPDEARYRFGPFLLDPAKRSLTRDGAPIALTYRVLETLLVLVRNPGRTVSKDELHDAIWPGRYMEESSLKQAIFSLRKILSGDADDTEYIVTASGHGYSFTANVERIAPTARPQAMAEAESIAKALVAADAASIGSYAQLGPNESGAMTARWRPAMHQLAWGGAAAILAVGIAAVAWQRNVPSAPAQPRMLILADFQNFTGDQALGTVLGKVLEIDLAQSPILNLMPPQRVGEALRLMERPEDTKLTPSLAQQVCARNGGNAVLTGSVAQVGSRFLVTLEARDCDTGANIAEAKADVPRLDDVPNMLDRLTVQVREGLNDSSASIRKFDVPIAQATTSSFEALKAYSLGENLRAHGDNAAALSFFKRAVELDSSFALAYAELGSAYFGLRETELGKAYYKKAFDLRDRIGENEKLQISAIYHERVGNYVEAVRSYQLWTQTYPQDWLAWAHLSNLLVSMARYPESIAAGREALRLNPAHYGPYSVLARAYKRATRFADAKAIGRLAIAKGFDSWDMHGLLYEIAYAEGDTATMAREVAKEKGKPTETWMLEYEAWGAATAGRAKQSCALFESAIETAREQGPDSREEVANFLEDYIDVLSILGLKQDARKLADTSTGLEDSEYAPFAFAMAGDFDQAARFATALVNRHPDSTEINDADIPVARAVIALGQGKPNDAIAALQPAVPYALRDFYTPSLLGQAYLETKAPDAAAAEFRKILANRGVDGLSPLYPLAYLGLARTLNMQGKLRESRAAYEQMFAFWKNADDDLPVLADARREYARIPAARQTAQQDSK